MNTRPLLGDVRQARALIRGRGIRWFTRAALRHLRARWAFRSATHVGTVTLRGRALVVNDGKMVMGDRIRLDGTTVRLEFICAQGASLTIGDGTYFNYGSNVSATNSVSIGKNCDIGQYAIIMDNDYHQVEDHTAMSEGKPVVIEDDVWMGARVTVLGGSHIGRGSVIGAHAVVKGEIPPYSLAVGVPARVVRSIQPETNA